MWRFKPSKYKNAIPKVPKKGEGWITDISVGSIFSHGHLINASAMYIAFSVDSGGVGNLGIVSINDFGSKAKHLPLLHAHSDVVTDFEFCPYDDGILATCSQDQHLKIWQMSKENLEKNYFPSPLADILLDHRIEVLKFNPQVDCLLSTATQNVITLWDINKEQSVNVLDHGDLIQNISWKHDGNVLASCGKDKMLRIWDARDANNNQSTASHSNNRDSRVSWLGDTDQLITTGFGVGKEREVFLRDVRKLNDPLAHITGDMSLGIYLPLFDPDTKMLFLIAKADTTVSFWEVIDKEPFLQEASKYLGDVQAKGAALVPKRALEFMDGEVNRVLILGNDCVVPVSFQVPRKTYREFHADLFPDTFSPEPSLTLHQWQAGEQTKVTKIGLGPPKDKNSLIKLNHHLGSGPKQEIPRIASNKEFGDDLHEKNILDDNDEKCKEQQTEGSILKSDTDLTPVVDTPEEKKSEILISLHDVNEDADNIPKKTLPKPGKSKPSRSFGIRTSKFRHLNGNIFPKEFHITDISGITKTVPGECNGFDANNKFAAVPIGAVGNFLAVFELSHTGRALATADMFGIQCGANIMDFSWDPFNLHRLVTACDNGAVQIWDMPVNDFSKKLEKPSITFVAHTEKVNILKFHPCAQDIISTASFDLTIAIWNLTTMKKIYTLTGHNEQVLSMAWSRDGKFLATVCKDQRVRIFEPRISSESVLHGPGPQGIRGARVMWVLGGTHIVVTGFSKVSERQVYLYNTEDLSEPVGSVGLDVSPATLIPHYDEDSSTLFLSGKGDSVIYAYEVATDSPYFHPLSHYKCPTPHQALSFFAKFVCNVKEVEFARALRLTSSTLEPISFLVPRVRPEYFQDDLFPDTSVTWEPSLTSEEWISGVNKPLKKKSLRPNDMLPLSEAQPPKKPSSISTRNEPANIAFEGNVSFESSLAFLRNSKEKEEKIIQSMLSQCQLQEDDIPQESFEGVDPEEWDEEESSKT